MKLNVTVDVPLTLEQLAGLFVELDDDSQAKFFVEVARVMQSWTPHERNMQAHYIGRHLRDCACSTEEARELLVAIVESMQSKPIEDRCPALKDEARVRADIEDAERNPGRVFTPEEIRRLDETGEWPEWSTEDESP